jgi:hypothetical protein
MLPVRGRDQKRKSTRSEPGEPGEPRFPLHPSLWGTQVPRDPLLGGVYLSAFEGALWYGSH